MISFSNIKINIGLNIINKREDGYHNLETIFYSVPLNDTLELLNNNKESRNTINFYSFGLTIDGPIENNLIVKAYNLLANDFELNGVDFYLLNR